VSGCLCPTPAGNLPILAGIQPAELRRKRAARRRMEPGHLLHSVLTYSSSANARRLKSRHPFLLAAQQLFISSDNDNICVAHWADPQWNGQRLRNPTRLDTFICDTGTHPLGMILPSTAWVRFNHLHTGVRRLRSCLHNGVWPFLRPVSVVQKNKPSTILSSNVPMDCAA